MPEPIAPDQLARCPIFQGMSAADLQQICELVDYESYPSGEVILREGKSIQILWVLTRGRCEVVKTTNEGAQHQLAVLEPMGVFGEMSFFNPAPHSASVRSLTDVDVIRLPREKFDRLVDSGTPGAFRMAINTLNLLAERLRRMDNWACELVEKPDVNKHKEEWREFRSKLYSDWHF